LPAAATIRAVSTQPAARQTVHALGRNLEIRWVQVDAQMAIANRPISEVYICAVNRNGDHIVVRMDGRDWIVR